MGSGVEEQERNETEQFGFWGSRIDDKDGRGEIGDVGSGGEKERGDIREKEEVEEGELGDRMEQHADGKVEKVELTSRKNWDQPGE